MGQKRRVLIVDDEPMARDVMEGYLFREGYQLDFAEDALNALSYLESYSPDVIVSDVMMPNMNGFELCQRLKADDRWRHIPIILVTALDGKKDLVRGLEAGADDFLSKPISEVEIRARVRSMLRIKQQYDELQAAIHLREDLANMIVHDMRTPLTAIIGYSSLLQERETMAPEDIDDAGKIYIQARRLSILLSDLLMIAKMEQTGKMILNFSMVDLNNLVQQVSKDHDITIRLKYINFVIDLPEHSPQLTLDENLWYRMFDNLLSNALKYSPPQSTVTVCVENLNNNAAAGYCTRIKVIDEGPGIPKENREHIFEKYGTVTLKDFGDSQIGLGLTFSKMVVEAHQGRIFVENNVPVGSIFIVEI